MIRNCRKRFLQPYPGYIDDVSVTLCDTTAVEELKIEDYRLKIYPNPASGNVTITRLFTIDSFLTNTLNEEIFLIPQIENTDSIITDTMNWVLISGEFTANGGEQFLTIGNFKNDSNTSVMQVQNNGILAAYYFIDDVSVTLCDTTAVGELHVSDFGLQIYPNPVSGNVTISAMDGEKIIITDVAGRKIKEYKISNNQLKINTDEYDNGVYFLALYNNNIVVSTRKLVVAK